MAGPVTSRAGSRFRLVIDDISQGRHREAYTLFCVGVVLTLLGLGGVVAVQVMLSAVLAALTFLVFQAAVQPGAGRPPLDQVLENRDGFAAFAAILPGVRDLRIYGPTAVSALTNPAGIRRHVLQAGGRVRILTLADNPQTLAAAAFQLDDNLDLAQTLRTSLLTAARLSAEPGFSCRQLPVNPGFSLVIVNADEPGGYLIYESHGFRDDSIADRMHIKITKADSPRWFSYWTTRFDAMWKAAQSPAPAPDTRRSRGLKPPSARSIRQIVQVSGLADAGEHEGDVILTVFVKRPHDPIRAVAAVSQPGAGSGEARRMMISAVLSDPVVGSHRSAKRPSPSSPPATVVVPAAPAAT